VDESELLDLSNGIVGDYLNDKILPIFESTIEINGVDEELTVVIRKDPNFFTNLIA
jgi:hypothetical protein